MHTLETKTLSKGDLDPINRYKSLITDYGSGDPLVSNKEEAEQLQRILHGHQDLTETFLGPSKKVQKIKKRLEKAQKQRRESLEREKRCKI